MRQFKINNGDIFSMNQALFFGIKLTTIGDNEWVYGSFAKHATLQFGCVSSSILILCYFNIVTQWISSVCKFQLSIHLSQNINKL